MNADANIRHHEFAGTYSGGVSDCLHCEASLYLILDNVISAGGALAECLAGMPQPPTIARRLASLEAALETAVCPTEATP